MNERRHVLVVSFFYPPDPAVGGRRVAKFVEYLPDLGWTPVVLTARTTAAAATPGTAGETARPEPVHATRWLSPWRRSTTRQTPRAEAPGPGARPDAPGVVTPEPRASKSPPALRERFGAGRIGQSLYTALRHVLPLSTVRMPDATLGWVPYALAEGHRILETHRFHAILSSAGPPSSHIVGGRLQRRSGLPWIADYRDLWSDNHWDQRIAPFRAAERAFERRIVRPARHLTTVAPTWAERLEALHGKPATVILNGFDPADYPDEPATPREPGLTLTYVGTLYWPGQSPEPLFAAIERLARGPDGQDLEAVGFRARFLGTQPGLVESLARSYDVQRWVERTPRVPHPESLARQRASAALLYIGWQEPAEGFLTAKIFEYLGANRPILAVGPPGGPASELLRECGLPDLTDDPVRIAQRLKGWIREFRSTGSLAASTDEVAIARYTRRTQTERLARLLDEVVS